MIPLSTKYSLPIPYFSLNLNKKSYDRLHSQCQFCPTCFLYPKSSLQLPITWKLLSHSKECCSLLQYTEW
jgi:hypothetical protein